MKKHNGTQTSSFGMKGRRNHNASKFYSSRLYEGISLDNVTNKIENTLSKEVVNKIFCNSSENMKELPDNSIHLMITSPPYNTSKEYDSNLPLQEYLSILKSVFKETYRVLINSGRACINVANLGRKPYIPLATEITKMMIEIGYNMRGEVIWNKSGGAGSSTAWGSWQSASNPTLRDIHEYILIFSKGDYKRSFSKSEKALKKNTIRKDNFIEWTKSIWTINPESARKIGHPAPFPIKLPSRLIELYSFTNDIILDPFMGSGSTAIAALRLKRNFVGYDTKEDYVKLAQQRISSYFSQLSLVDE